uniref:Uncharacterized protein n=1 Tax=Arundo donax TaxID=35708 RepID=A0A0A9FP90_ARUDO
MTQYHLASLSNPDFQIQVDQAPIHLLQ